MTSKSLKKIVIALALCQVGWFLLSLEGGSDSRGLRKEDDLGKVTSNVVPAFDLRDLALKSDASNLVVFDALGKDNNLVLVEHARRAVFKPDTWDCIGFMYAKEDRIPDDDPHLRALIDDLGCTVPRTPGIFWGDYLQFITPTLVDNYDYVALVLDDIYFPAEGPTAVNATKLIEKMETYDVDVMQPAITGDTYNTRGMASSQGIDLNCIVEVKFIETYAQFFTRDAWECYYKMLHYTGKRGWCYDVCYKSQCPDLKFGNDLSMVAWHMDRQMTSLPEDASLDVSEWKPEPKVESQGYFNLGGGSICARLQCGGPISEEVVGTIACPAADDAADVADAAEVTATE